MFASLLILLVLPFTDLSRIRGNHFKPLSRVFFWLIVCTFFLLMELGSRHAEAPYILMGQVATALYFSYFLILVPVVTLLENSLVDINMQTSITKAANLNSYFKNLRLVYAIFLPKAPRYVSLLLFTIFSFSIFLQLGQIILDLFNGAANATAGYILSFNLNFDMLGSTPLSMVSDLNSLNSEMSQIPSIVFSDSQGGSNSAPGLDGSGSNTGSLNSSSQSTVSPNPNPTNASRTFGNLLMDHIHSQTRDDVAPKTIVELFQSFIKIELKTYGALNDNSISNL